MSLHELSELVQGTPEWHDQRRGLVTASVVGKLISIDSPDALTVTCPKCLAVAASPCISTARKVPTPIKTIHDARAAAASNLPPVYTVATNDTARGLINTLVAERISGFTEDTPMTGDMWRGVECEPFARDKYAEHVAPVIETGFMVRDDWGFRIGYSPDGLVGDDGLIEIKAPRAKTHVATILADRVPPYYMAQLQTGLLVSGRKWIDFVSYCGGLPLWVKRVHPDPAWHEAIVAAVAQFEKAAEQMVAAFDDKTKDMPATERISYDIQIGEVA